MSLNCLTDDPVPKITYVLYKIPKAGYGISLNPTQSVEEIWSDGEIIFEVEVRL